MIVLCKLTTNMDGVSPATFTPSFTSQVTDNKKLFPLLLQIRFPQLVSKVDKEKLDLSFLCPPPTFFKYFSQWPSWLLVQTLEWSCHYLNDTICNAKGHCIHLLHYLPGTLSKNSIVCNLTFFQDNILYFPQTGRSHISHHHQCYQTSQLKVSRLMFSLWLQHSTLQ